ncbi:heterokaryon incompatibility protein-domain-containing protein [Zopfochytrium polystomum]|nr:heterokaryon incompatibility protein-domain-containing protein [Zopfochytrium polystomum]
MTHQLITERSTEKVPIRVFNPTTRSFDMIDYELGGYHAISHVWAKAVPMDDDLNTLNNNLTPAFSPAKVKALQTLLLLGPKKTWCDVYSIVQDDFSDKCAQVSVMSEIYRNADRVVVLLADEDADAVAAAAKTLADPGVSVEDLRKLAGWMRSLKWYKRAWTLQEYALAKHLDWRDASGALIVRSEDISSRIQKILRRFQAEDEKNAFNPKYVPQFSKAEGYLKQISPRDGPAGLVEPSEVTVRSVFSHGRYSSYLHDTIYAISGLLGVAVTVDYDRDFALVWNEFLARLLRAGKATLPSAGGNVSLPADRILPPFPEWHEADSSKGLAAGFKLPSALFRANTHGDYANRRWPVTLDHSGNVVLFGWIRRAPDPEAAAAAAAAPPPTACSPRCFFSREADDPAQARARADACCMLIWEEHAAPTATATATADGSSSSSTDTTSSDTTASAAPAAVAASPNDNGDGKRLGAMRHASMAVLDPANDHALLSFHPDERLCPAHAAWFAAREKGRVRLNPLNWDA